jgi:hypothetical protein
LQEKDQDSAIPVKQDSFIPTKQDSFIPVKQNSVIPANGAVEKGIDFNVTRNAFIKKT